VFDREAVVEGNNVSWNVDTLVSLPFGLQKRLIRLSFEKTSRGNHGLSAQNVASVMELLGTGKSGMSVQTGFFRCFREFNSLRFEFAPSFVPEDFCYSLGIPGRVDLPQTGTCFETSLEPSRSSSAVLNRWELLLSRKELEEGFCIRNWKPADVYFAPGASSPRRVADMFAEKKVPRRCRTSSPVVVLAGRVVCVRNFPLYSDRAEQTQERALVVIEERNQTE
jgi:hypothetical protein